MIVPEEHTERDRYRDLWWPIIIERYQTLRVYARRIVGGNIFDAEDLVHETVCRVMRYPTDPGALSSPLRYSVRIMRNEWLDKIRKDAPGSMDSLDDPLKTEALEKQLPTTEHTGFRLLENQELRETLNAWQGPLEPRERDLLRLCLEGMPCEDIAKKWGEDVRLIRCDWNALKAKIKYRVRTKTRGTSSGQ